MSFLLGEFTVTHLMQVLQLAVMIVAFIRFGLKLSHSILVSKELLANLEKRVSLLEKQFTDFRIENEGQHRAVNTQLALLTAIAMNAKPIPL